MHFSLNAAAQTIEYEKKRPLTLIKQIPRSSFFSEYVLFLSPSFFFIAIGDNVLVSFTALNFYKSSFR